MSQLILSPIDGARIKKSGKSASDAKIGADLKLGLLVCFVSHTETLFQYSCSHAGTMN